MALSEEAWKHIRQRHPEVSRYQKLIRDVLETPELILRGQRAEKKAVRQVQTHLGPKHLVVVYREEHGQKNIITAYFTSSLKRLKGELVWKA